MVFLFLPFLMSIFFTKNQPNFLSCVTPEDGFSCAGDNGGGGWYRKHKKKKQFTGWLAVT